MHRKRIQFILITIGLICTLAMGLFIFFYNNTPRYENIAEINKATNLKTILPTQLPSGSKITSQPTYQEKTEVTTTTIKIRDALVTISQQKRPTIDLKQLDAEETYLVQAGSVYILKGEENRFQAIVETKDSWVIVNAPESIGLQTFKDVIESLN